MFGTERCGAPEMSATFLSFWFDEIMKFGASLASTGKAENNWCKTPKILKRVKGGQKWHFLRGYGSFTSEFWLKNSCPAGFGALWLFFEMIAICNCLPARPPPASMDPSTPAGPLGPGGPQEIQCSGGNFIQVHLGEVLGALEDRKKMLAGWRFALGG